jgi:O-acetyl-ADP-ribose deacetylase (regulator of RNase III)
MIEYRNMDITTAEIGIVAHGVNCQKKMGSGVAKAIRDKWPNAYDCYMATDPKLGTINWAYIDDDLWIANCYTQNYYGYDGKRYADPTYIKLCLASLARSARRTGSPIYMPKIGCGLGGLSWEQDVLPLVQRYADANHIIVCEIGTQ